MKTNTMRRTLGALLILGLALAVVNVTVLTAVAASVTPTPIPGSNNDGKLCSDVLQGSTELRVDGPDVGGVKTDGTLTVTITQPSSLAPSIGASFDWTSNIPVLGVIVKDGIDGAFYYNYSPAGSTGDTLLTTPGPEPVGTYKNISHINFCYVPPTAVDLTVEKTADASYTRTFEWTIDKSADADTVYSVGGGESGAVNFTVGVTKSDPIDSDFLVSGTITVHNPNSFAVNGVSLSDSTPGGDCSVTPDSVNVAAGSDATADYECTFTSNPGSGTNTATATWGDIGSPNTNADGTADYTFGDPTTVINDEIDVTDTNGGSWTFTDSGSVEYSEKYTDPAGTCTDHENTATITQTGQDDSVTVQDCQGADLTVEKTATPSYDRSYGWTIDKSVDQTKIEEIGGNATFNYTVSVSHGDATDSNFVVGGKITVNNPNDWEDIVADVSDNLPGGDCSVTDGEDVSIPRGESVELDYSCTFDSNPSSGTNTATATWDADAAYTPTGSASDDAEFTFGDPTNVIDECVDVSDPLDTNSPHTFCVGDTGDPTFSFSYSRTVSIPVEGCVSYDNTATFTTNDTGTQDSDSETVQACRKVVLGKTMGFWGNTNGAATINAAGGYGANAVAIGRGSNIDTQAKSLKVLPNTLNACGKGNPLIFSGAGAPTATADCTSATGINKGTLNTSAAQTLAFGYNRKLVSGYNGQTINGLSCSSFAAAAGLTGANTVLDAFNRAVALINGSIPGGTTTQSQLGALNQLLGCLNRETP